MDDGSLTGRIGRILNVTSTLSGAAFKALGSKFLSGNSDHLPEILTEALGQLKGPAMKIGQIMAMVPGMLPDELATALMTLQSQAPAMGWPFVRRRMSFELGQNWQQRFLYFEKEAFAAASLGQVHKAQLISGQWVACKLQYPNMLNIIEGDLSQLRLLLSLYEHAVPIMDTANIQEELKHRLIEELDYALELDNMLTFKKIFAATDLKVNIPEPFPMYSTHRLLTMEWKGGFNLMDAKHWSVEEKKDIAKNLFEAWYYPLYHHNMIHGDPHFGNYRIGEDGHITLLDFGCVRKFTDTFVKGSLQLYQALKNNDHDQAKHAYEIWGFTDITHEIMDALNIWARFLYDPLLDDRVRPLILSPDSGKQAAKAVINALKRSGKVRPPAEFVFMDRAAVGIGSAMIHLGVELNWHELFHQVLSKN